MWMIRKFKGIVKTNGRCNVQIFNKIKRKSTIIIRNKWREFVIMGINVNIIEGNIRKNCGYIMDINSNGNITFYPLEYNSITFFKCKNNQISNYYQNYDNIHTFKYYIDRCLLYIMRDGGNAIVYVVRKYYVTNSKTTDFYKYKYKEDNVVESMIIE